MKVIDYWNNIYKPIDRKDIITDDWLDDFDNIISKCNTPILDLGCGVGNNTLYLINKNKKVIASDISNNAILNINKNFPEIYDTKCFNMLDGLPFKDNNFEIIVADLSLHYFNKEDTEKIIKNIKRVLCDDGYLFIRVNSIKDINHGFGKGLKIEDHLFRVEDGRLKRFFDEKDIKEFFKDFEIIYLKEEKMMRYKLEKIVYKVCLKKSNTCNIFL